VSSWQRGLWLLGGVNLTWIVVAGALADDWMRATSAIAGLAAAIPFWLRAERAAAAPLAPGGNVG
jgi:hypothetical protein